MRIELACRAIINNESRVIYEVKGGIGVYMCWEVVMLMEITLISKVNEIGVGLFIGVKVKVKSVVRIIVRDRY